MRTRSLGIGVTIFVGLASLTAFGQQRGGNQTAAPAQQGQRGGGGAAAVPDLPTDKTAFWKSDDIEALWKENESRKRANSRLFNGPTNISANVRIVLDNDPPATHDTTADLWIAMAGSAVARTDGQIVEENGSKTIRNGMQRPMHPGDILYVPPGIPHHFTDLQGFRALLVRFDTLGLVPSASAPQRGTGAAEAADGGGRGGRGGAAAPPLPPRPPPSAASAAPVQIGRAHV